MQTQTNNRRCEEYSRYCLIDALLNYMSDMTSSHNDIDRNGIIDLIDNAIAAGVRNEK